MHALPMCLARGKKADKTRTGCVRIRMEEMRQRERERETAVSSPTAISTGILTWSRWARAFRGSGNLDKKNILYIFSYILYIKTTMHYEPPNSFA